MGITGSLFYPSLGQLDPSSILDYLLVSILLCCLIHHFNYREGEDGDSVTGNLGGRHGKFGLSLRLSYHCVPHAATKNVKICIWDEICFDGHIVWISVVWIAARPTAWARRTCVIER